MRVSDKSERIDMRTNAQMKYYFELAAFLGGFNSLTSFVMDAAQGQANKIFEKIESEGNILSDRDRDLVLKILENPPEPNDALKKAIKLTNDIYVKSEGQLLQNVDDKYIKE